MPRDAEPGPLTKLLRTVAPQNGETRVSLGDIVQRIGNRSFAPVILIVALILVSPLSAIPGSPTVGMLLIVTVTVQALIGREHLWLPQFLMRRTVSAHRLSQALAWLSRPVAWVDRHSRNRLRLLTAPPLDRLPLTAILCTALPWPLLEPLPMVTSIGAFAVSLLSVGLMVRDGVYIAAGFVFLGALVLGLVSLWQGLI